MEYSVNIRVETGKPISDNEAFDLAELGGSASIKGSRYSVTVTSNGTDPASAGASAVERVTAVVAGEVVALEVLTIAEADRRLAEPPFPELVGVGEIAEMLGVTRQRASALQANKDFPAPVAKLGTGPVWRKADLSRFAETWARRGGRPAKALVLPGGGTALQAAASEGLGRI